MREPQALHTHYPNGITLLDNLFEDLFTGKKGPGALPGKQTAGVSKQHHPDKQIKAILTPHAAYDIAGPCMAWAYHQLSFTPRPDVYIIIGQAQKNQGQGLTQQTFKTPYAEVRVDQQLARSLLEKNHIPLNDELHDKETVIEVQLPFIQYINKPTIEKVKILPLLINEDTPIKEVVLDIKETLLDQNKNAVFIFTSNMTSYGRQFHFVPFTEHIPENIAKIDNELFKHLKAYDKKSFFETVHSTTVPLSGYFPLEMFFSLYSTPTITLENYYLSGELTGEWNTSVSFASLITR